MMYNAGELRLNNWLNFDSVDCPVQIDGIQSYMLSFNGSFTSIDDFNPIALTEEWLKKFGFRIGRKNYSLNSGRELHEYASTDYFIMWHNIQKGWCISELPSSNYIQSVHQLQNLFYALTGEELEIKL